MEIFDKLVNKYVGATRFKHPIRDKKRRKQGAKIDWRISTKCKKYKFYIDDNLHGICFYKVEDVNVFMVDFFKHGINFGQQHGQRGFLNNNDIVELF